MAKEKVNMSAKMQEICEANGYELVKQITDSSVDSKFIVSFEGRTYFTTPYKMGNKGLIPHLEEDKKNEVRAQKALERANKNAAEQARKAEIKAEFMDDFNSQIAELKAEFSAKMTSLKAIHNGILKEAYQQDVKEEQQLDAEN